MSGNVDTLGQSQDTGKAKAVAKSSLEIIAGLLSAPWYIAQLDAKAQADLADASVEKLAEHYLREGSLAGISPLHSFSPVFYRARYADQITDNVDPLVHYVTEGSAAGLSPHPLLKGGAPLAIDDSIGDWASDLFDAEAYFEKYEDVREAGVGALHHYLANGATEGRTPHILFDSFHYLGQLSDEVRPSDAFVNYIASGWKSYSPSPKLDVNRLFAAFPTWPSGDRSPLELIPTDEVKLFISLDAAAADPALLQGNAAVPKVEKDPLLAENVSAASMDEQQVMNKNLPAAAGTAPAAKDVLDDKEPLEEVVAKPGKKKRVVIDLALLRPVFDADYYREQLTAAGVEASEMDDDEALAHFASEGRKRRLKPFALFDGDLYLATYPDVAEQGADPLDHWLRFGKVEGRTPHPLITIAGVLASDFDPRKPDSDHYHPAFDVDYYAEQAGIDPDEESALLHYLTKGAALGFTPNRHFDPAHYRSQFPKGEKVRASFEHYIATGARDGKQPIPFFEPLHYAARSGMPLENALNKFVEGKKRASPHPLVDLAYYAYKAKIPGHLADGVVFQRLLSETGKDQNAFHPLFDIEYYEKQRPRDQWVEAHPLADYLEAGWKEGVSPHPMFDPEHYVGTVEVEDDEPPFLHFLKGPSRKGTEPNYLLREGIDGQPRTIIERWQNNEIAAYDLYYSLLDRNYYRAQLTERKIKLEQGEDPLTHYLREGFALGLSPNRLFMPEFYREKAGLDEGVDAFRHYWVGKGFRQHAPHCGVDLDFYEERAGNFDRRREPFLQHFLSTPVGQRTLTHPFLDYEYYAASNEDVRNNKLCPITHFLEHGIYEGRLPNRIFSYQYAVERPDNGKAQIKNGVMRQFLAMTHKPVRLIFVSHDSSRTGAPAIILRLMEDFAKFSNVECLCILTRGGERTAEFYLAGHTTVLNKGAWEVGWMGELARPEVERFVSLFADNPPVAAFVNSAESRYVGHLLKNLGIPVISLVHELADFYEPAEFDWIYRFSDRVVYPSKFVEARAKANVTLPPGKTVVRGQGLLRDGFGLRDRERSRKTVLKEFSLPEDTVLVVGCGTIDQRKGVDYFVNIAKLSLKAADSDSLPPLAFLWIGDGHRNSTSPYYMAQIEIKAGGLEQSIRFIGGREDVEPYFVAADMFLMTSRGDPFPCVIHEAMGAGLPCIAFEGGGGAPELIADSGVIIPLGDIEGAVNGILTLRKDVDLRKRLSARAKEIIREKGLSYDYFQFFIEEVEQLTGIGAKEMGEWRGFVPGQKPPIFFLQADWSISGVNTFTEGLIRYLNDNGYPAELLFTAGMDHMIYMKEDKLPEGVPVRFLKPHEHTQKALWARLQAFILSVGPCVVLPNFDYRGSAVTPLMSERVGVIGIAHSDHIEHYEHLYRLGRYWNKVVGVSRQIGEGIDEVNTMLTDRLSIIPYGVGWKGDDFDRLSALKAQDEEVLHLVYAGRFVVEQKNIYEYLKLADELNKREIPFRMHLCGDGPEYQNFATKAAGHVAEERIVLPGRMDAAQMDEIFSQGHVLMLLSDYEGLPLAMLEGMAHGCVPVCYRIDSGIGDVIETGSNGYIVGPRDVKAAADAIEGLWKDPAKRAEMSAAAFQTVKSAGLRTEDMGEKYAELIDQVYEEILNLTFKRPRSLTAETPLRGIIPSPLLG